MKFEAILAKVARARPPKPLHCAVCGATIADPPVRRHPNPVGLGQGKQVFCCEWHAQQYRPPRPWWRRWFDDPGTPHGTGCG
jgi:hypothetical protein